MGLRNHFAAKWSFRSRVPFSQPISQLRNEGTVLRNGTRVPKGCFAAAKHPAKLGYGCAKLEISRFGDFAAISQLRNGVPMLRNGSRVPRGVFAAAKFFTEGSVGL